MIAKTYEKKGRLKLLKVKTVFQELNSDVKWDISGLKVWNLKKIKML